MSSLMRAQCTQATRGRTRYELVPCGPIPCSLEVRNVPPLGVDGMQTGQRMSRARHGIRTEAGISLTELMCAMAAGLVVLGATLQALTYFQHRFMTQQYEVAQQQ